MYTVIITQGLQEFVMIQNLVTELHVGGQRDPDVD